MAREKLSLEEWRAWHNVTRSIRPLHNRAEHMFPPTVSAKVEADRDDMRAITASRTLPPLRQARPRTKQAHLSKIESRQTEKHIRRGKVKQDAVLDLHGHSVDQAIYRLDSFIAQQHALKARCVLIITGKGRPGEGKIRREFRLWLERADTARWVSGYAVAHLKHGGAGAFYLFLRRQKR